MKSNVWLLRPMVLAVGSCFGMSAWGNPVGPQVVQGTATFQGLGTNSLQVRNTPGAVINWQGFSIGQGQLTNFIQQNSSSAVLNRVVGGDISQIHGTLQSNGRVFLINPAGIVVGSTGIIDTAGFVGSTLNLLDADFIAGKLRFTGDPSAGGITNQGTIRTSFGGSVVLVAPHIENGKDALIQTPGGELILAAGQKVTIGTLDANGVQFEVQAPTDSVVNLGKLIAQGGAVGVFAGTLKHSGDIRADALVRDATGHIVLKGRDEVTVAGTVSATGAAGKGGDVQVLGDRVNVLAGGMIDVSGAAGGGRMLIGGDYQGSNPNVPNASRTLVAKGANLFADAAGTGDGGRIIVWADKSTRYDGNLSARGGPLGGHGGFAEVSGKESLVFTGFADLSAPRGALGSLLLDPLDLYVSATGGLNPDIIDQATDFPSNAVTVSPDTLAKIPGNVTLFASRYMRFNDAINLTTAGQTLTAQVGRTTNTTFPGGSSDLFPASSGLINGMDIGASITTNGGAVSLTAPTIRTVGGSIVSITTGGAPITLSPTAPLPDAAPPAPTLLVQAGLLNLDAGTGAVTINQGGNVQVRDITSAPLRIEVTGALNTGAITSTGTVDLKGPTISTGAVTANGAITEISPSSIQNLSLASGGGAVSLSRDPATDPASKVKPFIRVGNITAGAGSVNLDGSSINTFGSSPTIDTTGAVTLIASAGSIASTFTPLIINNAASVVATAENGGSTIVNLSSATALNANNVSAKTTSCSSTFCPATVTLSGANGVNVGTVLAEAPVTFGNNRNATVTINSSGGSIVGMAAASQVTATDVTLHTNTGSGGGIRGAGSGALNVAAERGFTLEPNGAFNVNLNGTGPNQLTLSPGLAAAGAPYSGALTREGAGTWASVSATESLVTVTSFAPTGFNDRVYNSEPLIKLFVPNGDLRAMSVVAPLGDTRPSDPLIPFTTATLPVTISASGNVQVDSYTRAAGGLPKQTFINSSEAGAVTLGSINASKDDITVSGPGGVTISSSTLTSSGPITVGSTFGTINGGRIIGGSSVTLTSETGTINTGEITSASGTSVTSDFGNVFVGRIDAAGAITLSAPFGTLGASANSSVLEAVSAASITATGGTIGTPGFANPLDLQAPAITLNSPDSGGRIGFLDPGTPAAPVVALTPNLTINAAGDRFPGGSFNVSTGTTALKDLTILASSTGASVSPVSGPRQASRVRSEVGQPNDKTYTFDGFGGELIVDIGTVPRTGGQTQFVDGTLSVTTNLGNLRIASNVDMGAGGLTGVAQRGSVLSDTATFDGRALDLRAGTITSTAPVMVSTAAIGTTIAPTSVSLTAGQVADSETSQVAVTGSVQTGGDVIASAVKIEASDGSIRVGATGTGAIGSAVARGAIDLKLNRSTFDAGSSIRTGNITGTKITGNNIANTIVTGNLDATGAVELRSRESVTTGNIDAGTIFVRDDQLITTTIVSVGAIGQTRAPTSATLVGAPLTIAGPVNGAAGSTLSFASNARGSDPGTTTIGGPILAGDGSTVDILSRRDFDFTRIDAGAGTSLVKIVADTGSIRQTASGGSSGIRARTVFLSAPDAITNTGAGGTDPVDVFNVADLTSNSTGRATFDVHTSTLERLTVNKGPIGPTTPFSVTNLGSGQSVTLSGGPDIALVVDSPTSPLNFELNYIGGAITLAGLGVRTSGGNATVTSNGAFTGLTDTSPTGLTGNGIHTAGGVVVLRAPSIVTGTIDTRTGVGGSGGRIDIGTNFGANILVSGDLRTGPTGGFVALGTGGGSITRSGSETIQSGTSVSATALGDIGTAGNRLAIEAPVVVLSAQNSGRAFAQLTGTNNLDLRGDQGFNVSSDTAFNTLAVSSSGTGAGTAGVGTLNLTAPGQTFDFAHPGTAFQVVRADLGASQPATNSATFSTADGDLLIAGGASSTPSLINVPKLTLRSAQDVRLTGDAANRLVLTNDIQSFGPNRDLLISGNAAITATAAVLPSGVANAQTFNPGRDIVVQAQGGKIDIAAPTQNLSTNNGNISFLGGSGAGDAVTVTGSINQFIATSEGAARNIVLNAGTGAGANVSVVYSGSGNASPPADGNFADQRIEAGGDVRVLGGGGADAIAEIRSGAGRQQVRADATVLVAGGAGTGANARIVHTGTADHTQQIGESRTTNDLTPIPLLYQTDAIEVHGGAGTNAIAEITSSARQQVFAQNLFGTPGSAGSLKVLGGAGAGAMARIDSTGTTEQEIGLPNYLISRPGFRMGSITVEAGTGAGSAVRISSAALQRVTNQGVLVTQGMLTVRGGADNATASLTGAGQDIRVRGLTVEGGPGSKASALVETTAAQSIQASGLESVVRGGAGADAFARIHTPATGDPAPSQSLSFSNLLIKGGAGTNAYARVDSEADQRLSLSVLTIEGGAGADAFGKMDGKLQANLFSGSGIGTTSLTGGGGTGAFAAFESDTSQSLSFFSITLAGGTATGTPARFTAAGSQSLSGSGITLRAGGNADTAVANAGALLEGHSQTISAGNVVIDGGAGVAGSPSDAIIRNLSGNQSITSFFSNLMMRSGFRNSTTEIVNMGDAQTISMATGIGVTGRAAETMTADVRIRNMPTASQTQTLTASSGGITIGNTGAGEARIISATSQSTSSQFLHVTTDSSGLSSLSATGNQRVVTTNGAATAAGGRSLRVAGIGTGTASIVSGATQLFEIDYPAVMTTVFGTPPPGSFVIGDTTSTGTSLIQGNNQFIFAGSATIQSGSGAASSAKLDASGTQVLSTLSTAARDPAPPAGTTPPGGITIASGSGAGSTASIDPDSQSLVSNGPMTLNAVGGPVTLVSNGAQNLIVTNGPLTLGGSSNAATASIFTSGTPDQQVITAAGGIVILPFASIGSNPAGAGAAALAASGSTNQLLRTQDELERTQSEFERTLDEAQADDRRGRRGIGACQ